MGRPRPVGRGGRHRTGAGRKRRPDQPVARALLQRAAGQGLGPFVREMLVFCALAAVLVALQVYQLYLNQWLQIRWRNWLTSKYLGDGCTTPITTACRCRATRPTTPTSASATTPSCSSARRWHRAGPAQLRRHAGVLCRHPLGIVGGRTAAAVRRRFLHPRLSGVGRADLRHLRHRADAMDRLAAGQAQFQPAAAGGGLPLQPGAGPREFRADRVAEGRARRTRAAVAAFPASSPTGTTS